MRLAVNIDHIATIRQARQADEPDPVAAAILCELAGAHGITVHLRGDRRHIQDRDVEVLRRVVLTKLNVEMAATREMVRVAQSLKPHQVTLVPERTDEITTEGGLDVSFHTGNLQQIVSELVSSGIRVAIFVDPNLEQIRGCHKIGVNRIEINTGKYADSWNGPGRHDEIGKIETAAKAATKLGMKVAGGHGLTYRNVQPIVKIEEIEELNIGHSIVARSALVGIERAVSEMLVLLGVRR